MPSSTKDPYEGIRRFLADYRSWEERRAWEERRSQHRRKSDQEVEVERRSGAQRRSGEERRVTVTDRRRPTPEQFTLTEIKHICEMILDPAVEAECPRCGGHLLVGPVQEKKDGIIREVHCTACRHRAAIGNFPEDVPGLVDS